MVGCNRLVRLIVLTLGVYLLVINVILWATEPEVNAGLLVANWSTGNLGSIENFQIFHQYSFQHYRGFSWFFERLSTFPGPLFTHGMLMTYANIVSGFSVTNNVGLDVLLVIFRILTTPILFSITVVIDIINNALWFIGFIAK